MKYIKHLKISFPKMIEIKEDLKKISVDQIYVSDISIISKKDPIETINIYYEFLNDFSNIKNLKDFLDQYFYKIFYDLFEIFIDNPDKYLPQDIKNIIQFDSEQSSQFLVFSLEKHKKDTV